MLRASKSSTNRVETCQRSQCNEQDECEHDKGDMARARNHSIVNLQHVKRRCEVEQIDRRLKISAVTKYLRQAVKTCLISSDLELWATPLISVELQRIRTDTNHGSAPIVTRESKKHQIVLISIFFKRLRQVWCGVSSLAWRLNQCERPVKQMRKASLGFINATHRPSALALTEHNTGQ